MKWRYKGKHRGEYRPSWHWSHIKCFPNGVCHTATRTVKLTPYAGGFIGGNLSDSVTIRTSLHQDAPSELG